MNSEYFQDDVKQFKPFLSVFFIVTTFFVLVFLKMEERRMSYEVLKLTREYKKSAENQKQKEIQLAKLTKPQFIENIAKEKLTLKRATASQIIQLSPSTSVGYQKTGILR